MVHHGSITTDEELNEAGWAGAYGAINGAAVVCHKSYSFPPPRSSK